MDKHTPGVYASALVFTGPGRSSYRTVGPLPSLDAVEEATKFWQCHRVRIEWRTDDGTLEYLETR